MISQIGSIRRRRSLLLEQLEDMTTGQLNQIAEGFNNNIIWNLGHMITVQQGVCYKRAGLPIMVSDDFWHRFKAGSIPKGIINDDEIGSIRQLLMISLDQLETDYNKQLFTNYTAWITKNGVNLTSIDDAIAFLGFHDGLHSGVIMDIKRSVIVRE